MKIILNKTRISSDRYTLINQGMGGANLPETHYHHNYCVVSGVDRGHGYQGYMSIDYFLTLDYVPQEAKDKLTKLLVNL